MVTFFAVLLESTEFFKFVPSQTFNFSPVEFFYLHQSPQVVLPPSTPNPRIVPVLILNVDMKKHHSTIFYFFLQIFHVAALAPYFPSAHSRFAPNP